jgi:hypothetical protein
MKALLLILICAITVLADGVNKPKPKPKPRRKVHKVEGIKVTPLPKPPKPPEMLTTKYDELLGYPFLKPLQPLNEIPPMKPEVITMSEVAVYPFEETHRPKLWFLLIGTAAIPFLIPHGEDNVPPNVIVPPPPGVPFDVTPTASPSPGSSPVVVPQGTSEVPEPSSIILFVSGVAMLFRKKIKSAALNLKSKH